MFVGTHEHSLDDKGRLILPSTFRGRLADGAYVTPLDHCLAILPADEFARMAEQLEDQVGRGEVTVNAVRAFAGAADFVTPDAQGRIRILPHHRETVGLGPRVIVSGALRRIEIWDPDRFADVSSTGTESLAEAIASGRGVAPSTDRA